MWAMARFNLQDALRKYAESIGVEVVWNARVDNVDLENCVITVGASNYEADIIIGADGKLIQPLILKEYSPTNKDFLKAYPQKLDTASSAQSSPRVL